MSQPTPAAMGTSAEGTDPVVEAALRELEDAAAGPDAQAQIDAAQRLHDVLQGRLSGVSGP